MKHPWGINWLCYHKDNTDFAHIERMQYRSVKLFEWMWNNQDFCRDLVAAMPRDAYFICRDIPLSEQKGDMYGDPVGTGQRHANEWIEKVGRNQVHTPLDRTFFEGVNEPESNQYESAIDLYTTAFCDTLRPANLRPAGWVFGTGHPSTIGHKPETAVDWHWYKASAAAIQSAHGIACFHAYGLADNLCLKDHLLRPLSCPYPLEAIYSEFGIDNGVKVGGDNRGFRAFMADDAYVEWLDKAQAAVLSYPSQLKLHSLQIFTYDSDANWKSFDIRPSARYLLEDKAWQTPTPSPVPPAPADNGHYIDIPFISVPGHIAPTAPDPFGRSVAFVLKWEGGYVNNPADPGGETNFGISKRSYPDLDIRNLTLPQAVAIYRRDYWETAGCPKLSWPLALHHFDAAVQHGPGVAHELLLQSGGDWRYYYVKRMGFYTSLRDDLWRNFGKGWMNRMAAVMAEGIKP